MRFSLISIIGLGVLIPTASAGQNIFAALDIERDQAAREVKALEKERKDVGDTNRDVISKWTSLRAQAPELIRLQKEYDNTASRLFDSFHKTCGGGLTDDLLRCADPRTRDATRPIEDAMIANYERVSRLAAKIKQHNSDMDKIRPTIAKLKSWKKDWEVKHQVAKDRVTLISENIERRREQTKSARVEIETRILPPDRQAGMKSVQSLNVDFEGKAVDHGTFRTGATTIARNLELASIRNMFSVTNISSNENTAKFTVVGQTASGVGFMPSIDYSFTVSVERGGQATLLAACHNKYPAYKVIVNGRTLYDFRHTPHDMKAVYKALYGKCDYKPSTPQRIDAWILP